MPISRLGRGGKTLSSPRQKEQRIIPLSDEQRESLDRCYQLKDSEIKVLKEHITELKAQFPANASGIDLRDKTYNYLMFNRLTDVEEERRETAKNDYPAPDEKLPPLPVDSDSIEEVKDFSEPPKKKKKKKKKSAPIVQAEQKGPCEGQQSLIKSKPNTDPIPEQMDTAANPEKEPTTEEKIEPSFIRNSKFLIRGLSANYSTDLLKQNLRDFSPVKIIQFRKREGTAIRPLPLFLIVVPRTANHERILDLPTIEGTPITVERFRGGRFKIQCFNCQNYGHTQRQCKDKPRCMKCSLEHPSYLCKKPHDSPPKCCNCGGDHTANFSGCPARVQKKKQKETKKTATSNKDRLKVLLIELQDLIKHQDLKQLLQKMLDSATTD